MKASEYNQFSPALKKTMKPDERATYRILNVKPDNDNPGKFLMPSAYQIRPTDVVYDKIKGDFVTVAAIERQDNDGNPVFLNIVFTSANMGYLFLNGSNPTHQKIYQYLELSNHNESNKDRNMEYEPIFYRVDNKKEAMEERQMRKLIVKAVNIALDLDDKKAKEVALALGIDAESMEEIRNLLEDYAGDEPEEFMLVVERSSLESESVLKEAIKQGIIKNNVQESAFMWSETEKEIYKYKKSAGKNYVKELAEYLEENNPNELNAIKTRLG